MPWVDVSCENEDCPGREAVHPPSCRCRGTTRVMGEDPHTYTDCPEEGEVIPARWSAFYRPARQHEPGEYDETIYCASCGIEGVEAVL